MLPSASPATTIYILQNIKLDKCCDDTPGDSEGGCQDTSLRMPPPEQTLGEYFADLNYHFAWVKKASRAENKSEGYQRKLICQNIRPWVGGVLEGEATDVSNIWLLVEVVRAKTHT